MRKKIALKGGQEGAQFLVNPHLAEVWVQLLSPFPICTFPEQLQLLSTD